VDVALPEAKLGVAASEFGQEPPRQPDRRQQTVWMASDQPFGASLKW
jgi:hypothetical protein